MVHDNKLVEKVAQETAKSAFVTQRNLDRGLIQMDGEECEQVKHECDLARFNARAAIEAVRAHDAEAGMVLVPREATEAMAEQADRAYHAHTDLQVEISSAPAPVVCDGPAAMRRAYAAMLTAHERTAALEDLADVDSEEIASMGQEGWG